MIGNMWKSYMCAAGKKRIAKKAILAAMNTNERVVEIRPKKNSRPYGIWTMTYGPEFFSGLIKLLIQ